LQEKKFITLIVTEVKSKSIHKIINKSWE